MNAFQIIAIFVIVLGVLCDFARLIRKSSSWEGHTAGIVVATLFTVVSAGALPLVLYLGGFFK